MHCTFYQTLAQPYISRYLPTPLLESAKQYAGKIVITLIDAQEQQQEMVVCPCERSRAKQYSPCSILRITCGRNLWGGKHQAANSKSSKFLERMTQFFESNFLIDSNFRIFQSKVGSRRHAAEILARSTTSNLAAKQQQFREPVRQRYFSVTKHRFVLRTFNFFLQINDIMQKELSKLAVNSAKCRYVVKCPQIIKSILLRISVASHVVAPDFVDWSQNLLRKCSHLFSI